MFFISSSNNKIYLLNLYSCDKNLVLLILFIFFSLQLTVIDNISEVKVMDCFRLSTLKIIQAFDGYLPFQS